MRLNQDKIQRMIDGRGGVAGGGSSIDPGLIAGLATEAWTEENYVSKTFFNELFVIHKKTTTTVYDGTTVVSTTVDTSGTFAPNEIPSEEESTDSETGYRTVVVTEVDNIEAKKGLWTDFFLSALGLNAGGGGGGIGDVTWQALADNTDTRQIASSHLTTALSSALTGYATQSWVTAQNYVTSSAISDMATKTWVNNQSFVNWTALGDSTTTQQIALSHLTTALSGYATQNWVTSNFSTPSTVATQLQTYAKIQNGTITIGDTSLTPITSVTGTFWGKSFTNGGTVNGTIKAGTSGGAIEQFHSIEMNSAGTLSGYGGFIDFHYYATGTTFDSTLDYTSRIIESSVGVISIMAKDNDATNANRLAGLLVGAGFDGSYIQIGDLRIVYDSTNNALKVVKLVSGSEVAANFYATGSVSALGYGSGGGGGTGDVTWTNLADNSDTRQIALSHLTGALAGYATTSQLAGYLPLTGGTLTNANFGQSLTIHRNSTGGAASIRYTNTDGTLGYLGILNDNLVYRWNSDYSIRYLVWDAGTDGAGSGLDADLLDGQHASYFATASSLSSYLPKTGGELSGTLTCKTTDYGTQLTVYRNETWGNPAIKFQNKSKYWYFGFETGNQGTEPYVTDEDTSTKHFLLTSRNLSTYLTNYVTLTGAQTISATKTFTTYQVFKNSNPNVIEVYRTASGGAFIDYYANNQLVNFWRVGGTDTSKFAIYRNGSSSSGYEFDSTGYITVMGNTAITLMSAYEVRFRVASGTSDETCALVLHAGEFRPWAASDELINLGSTNSYWKGVYAAGFYKKGSSNSYVLLAGGGHKAVSDFAISGGTVAGPVTFSNSNFGQSLTVARDASGGASAIKYINTDGTIGYIGLLNDGYIYRWDASTARYLVWDAGNDGSGSGLDADLLDGQHGSYYATASSLSNYLPLTGGTLTGTLTCKTSSYGTQLVVYRNMANGNPAIKFSNSSNVTERTIGFDGVYSAANAFYFTDDNSTNKYWVVNSGNIGSYNAGSATKLHTARTIWGQSFDGTANVSGAMTGVGSIAMSGDNNRNDITCAASGQIRFRINPNVDTASIAFTETWFGGFALADGRIDLGRSASRWATLYANYGNFYGSNAGIVTVKRNNSGGGAFIDYMPCNQDTYYWRVGSESGYNFAFYYTGTEMMRLTNTGNLGIGTSSPSYKLDVNGATRVNGNLVSNTSGGAIEGFHSWELNTHNTAGTNIGGFLDFHYNGTAQDYSVRLIEKDYSGVLQILAKDTGTGNAQRAGLIVGAGTYTSFIQIGNGRIVWNDTDHALRIVDADGNACNLYATGGISALGYQSGGGGGGSTGVFSTSITPETTGTYDLGTTTYKWRNLYLAGTTAGGNGLSIITNYSGRVEILSVNYIKFGSGVLFEENIGIGYRNSNYDLYVDGETGNGWFAGTVTQQSDIRRKDVISNINLSIQQIASAPAFRFRFKDERKNKRIMIGTSAQYWDAVLPESVTHGTDDVLGFDYGVTALVSTIILAKGMTEHERRITKLEMENAELRARIKDLEEQ